MQAGVVMQAGRGAWGGRGKSRPGAGGAAAPKKNSQQPAAVGTRNDARCAGLIAYWATGLQCPVASGTLDYASPQ
jgi:hypothetical protein